ncbi:MAG: hypothetical protein F4146_04775 [Rhodothermaceae bacterium]|nr:hypothetical protein [Rhodothermaceae bacterium]
MHGSHTPLLAKISPMFSGKNEDVAVEALGHILNGSQPARDALSDVLQSGGAEVGRIMEVKTQVTIEEDARPDLAAFNEDSSMTVLIEAKFWAGLTENQPVAYLRYLLRDPRTSALLFIAPHARRDSLWAELERRIKEADFSVSFKTEKKQEELLSAPVGEKHWLILTSWTNLLDRMAAEISAAGDTQTSADIVQLRGLAAQEDATAFMPLRSEEIGPDIPRRLMGLNTLVDQVTRRLHVRGYVSLKGVKATPQKTGYIRYIKLAGTGASFGIDFSKWATLRDTPLWLILRGWKGCKPLEEVWNSLDSFRRLDPPALFKMGGQLVMPIELPLGLERDAVLDKVVGRLEGIARQIDPTLGP